MTRAKQSIPPATRRLVMRRDRGQCVVPGCTHAAFVDVRHLDLRSEGGQHDPERLVVLCGAHHRALHRGQLQIAGSVSTGLTFRHADGSAYGHTAHPQRASAFTKAFQALRALGFAESKVRPVLAGLQSRTGNPPSTQELVRQAVRLLTPQLDHDGATTVS